MSEFKREEKYLVLKIKDLDVALEQLHEKAEMHLKGICTRIQRIRMERGKGPIECVVVESSWEPEYSQTWDLIKARVEGPPSKSAKERLDSVDLNALIDAELRTYGRAETGRLMAVMVLMTHDGINKLDADYEIFAHMDLGGIGSSIGLLQAMKANDVFDTHKISMGITQSLARVGSMVVNRVLEVAGRVVDERIEATRERESDD